tara:strand:- start:117 stop:866 length:750 start_codon:yes stop_codon:yes gene_type:complete
MASKLLKKIVGAAGYKLFDKNYVENSRLINQYSSLNIREILKFFFEKKEISSLIQIGANDGESFDELSTFIKKYQINSILVEPIDEHFQKLKNVYSSLNNVLLEKVAISEDDKKKYLYSVKKEVRQIYGSHAKAISSFDFNHLTKHGIKKKHIEKVEINTSSIKRLIEKHKLDKVDLFFCDAEGYDGQIILSFLNCSINCKIIVFEFIHIENKILKTLVNNLEKENFRLFPINENLVCVKKNIEILLND